MGGGSKTSGALKNSATHTGTGTFSWLEGSLNQKTMLLVYVVSAIVAGVLVLFSLFGGDHDHDFDTDADADVDVGGHDVGHDIWLPFFSLRFYTYFFAGFGFTGLLLHYLTQTPPVVGAWMSAGVGLATGLVVSILMRLLKVSETTTTSTERDVLGKEGTVLVAIRGSDPGRIRCSVKGEIIDFLATAELPETIEVGAKVVVVAMENGRAQVVLRDSIFEEEALPQRIN